MSKKIKQVEEFEWPEFDSDRERIKVNSKRFKDLSISEAFTAVYDIKFKNVKPEANEVPKDLVIGDVISLNVMSIAKNKVEFDVGNYKTTITSSVNLHKYDKFKHFLPTDPVKVRVTNVEKGKVTVDPLGVLVDEWLGPIIEDPNIQKVIKMPQTIKVKDLQLTRGGFVGKAVIPNVSNFVGEDYTIEAFIPGSQIVLNITDNFEQFIGKEVEAFVLNYMQKPGNPKEMSLICSAKELLKFKGECSLIETFNSWCEEGDLWKQISINAYEGKVTGIINSSKKCGVFVEIPELNITGMVSTKPDELVNFKPQDIVTVKLTGFDEEKKYNPITKQMQHVDPYVIENGCLIKCNVKPVLEFV